MAAPTEYKLDNFEVSLGLFHEANILYTDIVYIYIQKFYNVIDNNLTTTEKTRQAVDPSTEELLPAVPVSTQADVDRAVAAAQAAFPAWSSLSQDERADYLTKFVDAIEANQEGFAQLLGREAGKPPGGVGLELFLLTRQIRETLKHKLTEETIEDTDEVRV